MRKVLSISKASVGFMMSLFRPSEPVVGFSPNGHSILNSWEGAPEEFLIAESEKLRQEHANRERQMALYCIEGPHAGELLFLGRSFETLGRAAENSVTVTPAESGDNRRYQLLINGVRTLMAETGDVFRLNGREEHKCELYDYDELELLGNRFVVLDAVPENAELKGVENE